MALAIIVCASVFLRKTVRIALMVAPINSLEVKLGKILNAYLQAPVTQEVWTTLDPEFGKDVGKTAVIVRALNSQKSAGAAFGSHLARCMDFLGYESCKANPNLWLKPEIRPEDGVKYYSYLFCYVDDILCIHHNADAMLEWLHKSFPHQQGFSNPDM